MSGEAAGAIVGGVVLLGVLPVVLAGVAIAGCAAGTVALGSTAVKAGIRHREKKKRLEVEACSQELSDLYRRMQGALDRQSSMSTQYYQSVEHDMEQLSWQLQARLNEGRDAGELTQQIQRAKRESAKAMEDTRRRELDRIHREGQAELSAITSELKETQKTKQNLLNWKAETATAKAQQKALAQDILRDAKATLNLLRTLAGSAREEGFLVQVEAIQRSYQTAEAALDAGSFQQAVAGGQRIISRGAALALAHSQKQMETDELLIALEARLEGLKAELEARRVVAFEDELYGPIEEDLDDFTQGEYSQVLARVQDLLAHVRSGGDSPARLEQLLEQVENELVPHADRVVRVGGEKLLGYYEKLHALQTIGGYMQEQGYQTIWAQPAGGDVTQKLAVQFREPVSGNTISVALDGDTSAEDIGKMAMEVMFYYQNGRPVTEDEKRSFRDGMLNALRSKGLDGTLSCTGSVNREAADKRLETAEAVEQIEPRPIFQEGTGQ